MTSKEALHIIKWSGVGRSRETYDKAYDLLVKDLEVLEILKRVDWLVYNNGDKNDFNWYIDTNKSMKLTEEEAEKIQEWLENDT